MRVLNKRDLYSVDLRNAVYIGRGSKFGNPFSHLSGTLAKHRVNSREEAILAYRGWLLEHPELIAAARVELKGKDLLCWCAPLPCHGDALLDIANDFVGKCSACGGPKIQVDTYTECTICG